MTGEPMSWNEFRQRRHDEQERRSRSARAAFRVPDLPTASPRPPRDDDYVGSDERSGVEQQRDYVPDWAKPRLKFPEPAPKVPGSAAEE